MIKFKVGDVVRVRNNDLDKTNEECGLDDDGVMLSMRGNIYMIERIDRDNTIIKLADYHFHIDDVIFTKVDSKIKTFVRGVK